jgi:hypothetical protein
MVAVVAVALVIAGLLGTGVVHVGPRRGIDRVRHLVHWPGDCADIATHQLPNLRAQWPRAREAESVVCEMAGPGVVYVRFAGAADVRHDLRRRPPDAATCLAGGENLIDALDPGQFAGVCRSFGGSDVNGVRGVPEPGGVTEDELDRSVRLYERRAERAELRALQAFWRVRPG